MCEHVLKINFDVICLILTLIVAAFGGCIRNINFPEEFLSLDFFHETSEVVNINMDGCTPYHLHADTCKDDLITHVYNGTEMLVYDVNLHAYTGNNMHCIKF